MYKTRWTVRVVIALIILASARFVTVWAQNLDEDSQIVSEELAIESAVNPEIATLDESVSGVSTDATAEVSDLESAVGQDLVMPDAAAEVTPETAASPEPSPAAEEAFSDLTTESAESSSLPAMEVADPAAGELAVEVAPELAPDALGESAAPELPVIDTENADAAVATEAPADDALSGLEMADESVAPVATESEKGAETVSDDLSGLEMQSDLPVAGDEGGVTSTTVSSGVPTDLVAEEGVIESSMNEVAPAAEDMSSMESGIEPSLTESTAVESGATEATTPTTAATSTKAAKPSKTSGSSKDKAIRVMREGEELRRRAFAEHAAEKLIQADEAFKKGDYIEAQRFYDQAINSLEQAGGRAENRTELDRARAGSLESLYRRAVQLRKEGDLDNALRLAREASLQGHPKAPALVDKLVKEQEKPAPPSTAGEPRWKEADYKEKQAEVLSRLRSGREHYYANELDPAQEDFESILAIDPHNTEAIRWREKVTQTRFDRASLELETTRHDMMSQVREAWNPGDYGVGEMQTKKEPGEEPPVDRRTAQDKILEKMENIIIPEIDFRQANIHDVVQFLQDNSIQWDKSTDGTKGVNIILNLGTGDQAAAVPAEGGDWAVAGTAEPSAGASDTQSITFRAREISLLEALKIVTDVSSLKYRVEGNVVIILPFNAPEGQIVHRMYDVLPTVGVRFSELRQSQGGTEDGFLGGGEGAAAESGPMDWKAFFTEMGVSWPIGSSIKYVPAIGKLMVANTAENLTIFEQRLQQLNVIPKQIEIEARFVEVNQTDLSSFGLEWLLTDDWEIAQKKSDADLPLSQRQRVIMPETDATKANRYVTDNAASDQAPEDLKNANDAILGIASILTNPELSVILHAMQQKGNADLLSAPKVTTQSGVEATIKVVTEYIYPSDYTIEPGVSPTFNSDGSLTSAGTPPVVTPAEFETREVGVILTVLPEVSTEGEMINLTMSPEVVTDPTWRNYGQTFTDSTGGTIQIPIEQPFFHTRSISTSILIYNGATVVMGGMITEDRQQVEDQIPFLGDIPLLGRLFKSSYDHSLKKNLLIFVTARLVDPAGRLVGTSRAPNQIAEMLPPAPAK